MNWTFISGQLSKKSQSIVLLQLLWDENSWTISDWPMHNIKYIYCLRTPLMSIDLAQSKNATGFRFRDKQKSFGNFHSFIFLSIVTIHSASPFHAKSIFWFSVSFFFGRVHLLASHIGDTHRFQQKRALRKMHSELNVLLCRLLYSDLYK